MTTAVAEEVKAGESHSAETKQLRQTQPSDYKSSASKYWLNLGQAETLTFRMLLTDKPNARLFQIP